VGVPITAGRVGVGGTWAWLPVLVKPRRTTAMEAVRPANKELLARCFVDMNLILGVHG
jgi:hypothetical protein